MASGTDLLRKARLRYVIDTYFDWLPGGDAYLIRRYRDKNLTPKELERIARHPILKVTVNARFDIEPRTGATYLALGGPPVPQLFVTVICMVLTREYACRPKDRNEAPAPPPDSATLDAQAQRLANYVWNGQGSAFAILSGTFIGMDELSFEHLLPPISPDTADADFQGRARKFLRGGAQRDWDVVANVAIKRDVEQLLVDAVEDGAPLIVLTAAAGDGKSTLLRRLALALRSKGRRVFFAATIPRRQFELPPVGVAGGAPTCILIDDADNALAYPDLEQAIHEANVQIVLCARTYQWQRRKPDFVRELSVEIPRLSRSEVDRLSHAIADWGAADEDRPPADIAARINRSVESDYPHLLAAMMTATRGMNFQAIVDGIVREFEEAGDDWALIAVACGAFVNDLSEGTAGRLPSRLFRHAVAQRLQSGTSVSEVVARKLRSLSSEIIAFHPAGGVGGAEYDLRHPDISYRVLERSFGLHMGRGVADVDGLSRAICEFVATEFNLAFSERRGETLQTLRYSAAIARMLLKRAHQESSWLNRSLSRDVARTLLGYYSTYEAERERRCGLLVDWAQIEGETPDQDVSENGGRLSDELFAECVALAPDLTQAWTGWMSAAKKRGQAGSPIAPDRFSMRWIASAAWDAGVRSENFLIAWMAHELDGGNAGTEEPPPIHSTRWIARAAWDAGMRSENFLVAWMAHEMEAGNAGAEEPPPIHSARWIARAAWDAGVRSENLLLAWMAHELEAGNAGAEEPPPAYSARWIARAAWDGGVRSENFLVAWMAHEVEAGNAGAEEPPPPYSARWIARGAWDAGMRLENFVVAWMAHELEAGNAGAEEPPPPYSARWIARAAWDAGVRTESFLIAWMAHELDAGNVGTEEPLPAYSARWIARAAWSAGQRSATFVIAWAKLERGAGNLGDFDHPRPDSTRGLLRSLGQLGEHPWAMVVANIEYGPEGVVGDGADPAPWSARHAARMVWHSPACTANGALQLARLEAHRGPDRLPADAPYSAEWIFDQARARFGLQAASFDEWIAGAWAHPGVSEG